MDSEEKCHRLADEIRKILGNGVTLSSEVIHYIDSTFSNPTTTELQTILQDDSRIKPFNFNWERCWKIFIFRQQTKNLYWTIF